MAKILNKRNVPGTISSCKAQMPSFKWIFALIIGAMILFLALYFVGRITKTGTHQTSVELASSLDILLNPFASIGGIGKISLGKTVKLPVETMMEFSCSYSESGLGEQGLSIRSKGSFGKWNKFTPEKYIYDKYVYANSGISGKQFYVLSKPFELPFRIDDLIYIIAEDYCFLNAPEGIEEELGEMNISAIKFENAGKCKTVCFDKNEEGNCDINIYGTTCDGDFCETTYEYGIVKIKKEGPDETLTFIKDAQLYAAIFSDSEIYTCNFKRLMNRLNSLCDIYAEKASMLPSGCDATALEGNLRSLRSQSQIIDTDSEERKLREFYDLTETLADANSEANCQVF